MTDSSDQHTHHEPEQVEQMLCPHCMEPVDPISHFCNACGGPISAHAAIDPMGQVYSAGHAYRNSTNRPTKLITVLGIWLIFGPQVPLLILIALIAMQPHAKGSIVNGQIYDTVDPFGNLTTILLCLGVVMIYCLIIYKSTRGYIRTQRQAKGLCQNCRFDLRAIEDKTKCPGCGEAIEWLEDDGEESSLEA